MKESFEKFYNDLKLSRKKCPWAKEHILSQHLNDLRSEIDEVEQALKKKDDLNLKEELGDVFWDTLYMLVIAEEEKGFNIKEIIENARAKQIRRKPWVFGNVKVNSKEEAIKLWNEIKKKEKEK